MEDIKPMFACPACARAVVNRKIARCMYCGAELPAAVLLSADQIDHVDEQSRAVTRPRQNETIRDDEDDSSSVIFDAIEAAIDLSDLF